MAKGRLGTREFLRALPRMQIFWFLFIGMILGLAGTYFYLQALGLQALGSSLDAILITMSVTFMIGIAVVLYACYLQYSRREEPPVRVTRDLPRMYDRSAVRREVVATFPLTIGLIGGLYFFIKLQLIYGAVVLLAGVGAWHLLRFTLCRKKTERSS